jgi:hypothetical protein
MKRSVPAKRFLLRKFLRRVAARLVRSRTSGRAASVVRISVSILRTTHKQGGNFEKVHGVFVGCVLGSSGVLGGGQCANYGNQTTATKIVHGVRSL